MFRNKKEKKRNRDEGFAHLLLLVAVVGLLAFFALVSFAPFRNNLFSSLFPKDASHAASPLDWPQVQKDANHSGYVTQTVTGPYTKLWRRDQPFPVSSRVQPVIASNLVFLPSNDGSLYALKTSDGTTAWKYSTNGALVNSAGVDNGKVFFGSTDYNVYAVNVSDGSFAWKYQTGSTVKTAPVLANGKVYIGSSDGSFYALDQSTGTLVWKYIVGVPIYDTAGVDNNKVFFGAMDSVGYALDGTTGALIWKKPILGQGFRDRWTTAGNGKVFFTPQLQGHFHKALGDGNTLFHNDVTPLIYNQPWSTQKQTILNFLAQNPNQQPIYIFDQATGSAPYTAPILYITGGSQSSYSPPVLLPNGNANVLYRRSFGEFSSWGATSNDVNYVGELNLTTGDITPVTDGTFKFNGPSDESATLTRSGDVFYDAMGRGVIGGDITLRRSYSLTCYSPESGGVFNSCASPGPFYANLVPQGPNNSGGGWIIDYSNILGESTSDGNDLVRPVPIVDDTLYILHYSTIVAYKGVKR